jgi:tripartite-type tricarboxylate transporter receptor subunit TctC
MRYTHRVAQLLAMYSIISGATTAHAQNFPNRPVRIVTSEPGGGNDFNSRLIAPGLGESIGQPVIVENRGAAPGPAATAARAQPDGYTLLIYSGTLWIMPLIRRDVAFDPVKDFSPVALATSSPNVLVVHPTLPVKSVKELISTVKRRPGEFNYSTGPRGSTPHLAMELFKALAGVDIVSINYKGIGPAIIGLVGGQVQMTFASPGGISQQCESGQTACPCGYQRANVVAVSRTADGGL